MPDNTEQQAVGGEDELRQEIITRGRALYALRNSPEQPHAFDDELQNFANGLLASVSHHYIAKEAVADVEYRAICKTLEAVGKNMGWNLNELYYVHHVRKALNLDTNPTQEKPE